MRCPVLRWDQKIGPPLHWTVSFRLCYYYSMSTEIIPGTTAYVRDISGKTVSRNSLDLTIADPAERDKVLLGFLSVLGMGAVDAEDTIEAARNADVEVDTGSLQGVRYAVRIL